MNFDSRRVGEIKRGFGRRVHRVRDRLSRSDDVTVAGRFNARESIGCVDARRVATVDRVGRRYATRQHLFARFVTVD